MGALRNEMRNAAESVKVQAQVLENVSIPLEGHHMCYWDVECWRAPLLCYGDVDLHVQGRTIDNQSNDDSLQGWAAGHEVDVISIYRLCL